MLECVLVKRHHIRVVCYRFSEMEFTTTEKGRRKLIKDGYMYVFKKQLANDNSSWECVLRRKESQCRATVKLSPTDEFIEQNNEHTYAPATEVEVTNVLTSIKRKAETTDETSQQILGRELALIFEDAAANLPAVSTIRRGIRKVRENQNVIPNPQNRDEIPVLPLEYQQTASGEQFLIYDSGVGDAERIFIFASESGLRLLSECDYWYGDGTFKVCPDLYFQLYTIHGQQNGNIYPCVFALLPNKTANTYVRFFQEVFNRVDNQPADILLDFERAAINAIQHLNGNIDVKGCFYHLSSNIWKKIQHFFLFIQNNKL